MQLRLCSQAPRMLPARAPTIPCVGSRCSTGSAPDLSRCKPWQDPRGRQSFPRAPGLRQPLQVPRRASTHGRAFPPARPGRRFARRPVVGRDAPAAPPRPAQRRRRERRRPKDGRTLERGEWLMRGW